MEQAREIKTLVKELADLVPVALCSGNHDNAGRLVSHDRASVYEWLIDLGTHRNIITDGSTRKLENLIVTTIRYHCSRKEKIHLARSRFHDSQTNRNTVDRSSSRSGQIRLGRQRRRIRGRRTSCDLSDLITSSRGMIMRFPTRLAKAGTKNWASLVCWYRAN
jgi:hypothetical protein